MNETRFWELIEATRAEITGLAPGHELGGHPRTPGKSDQPALLLKRLLRFSAEEIVEFDGIFTRLLHAAYRWDLWAAAHIIAGGCSEDGFMDFRAGLIGLGQQVYREALEDPSTLARQTVRGGDFSQDGLLDAAALAYQQVAGLSLPERTIPHPRQPTGVPFDESTVHEKYPLLAERFRSRG